MDRILSQVDGKMDEIRDQQGREVERRQKEIWEKFNAHDVQIAMLQVRSGLWGAVAGLVVAVAAYFLHAGH